MRISQNGIKKNINPPTDQWQAAYTSLSTAIELVPNHPDYLETMASLYHWQVLLQERQPHQITESLNLSKDFYQQAIKLRPAWPFSWANFALIKQQLNELDEEYNHAIERAVTLGAWESKLQNIVTQATLPSWQQLNKDTQNLVVENSFRALHSNAREFIAIAKQHNMLTILCGKFKRDELVKKACSDKQFR